MPNAYRCHFVGPSGGFFSTHIVRAATIAQAIDSCEDRMKSGWNGRGCIGFEIWQGDRRLHRLHDPAALPSTIVVSG